MKFGNATEEGRSFDPAYSGKVIDGKLTLESTDQPFDHPFTITGETIGDGYVRLVDIMGDDQAIEQAARVSYGQGTRAVSDTRSLLRYLLRNRHSTPFEMVETKWHMKLPIFVARQLVRHRTASINEYSMRYSQALPGYFMPDQWRGQSTTNKQGGDEVISFCPHTNAEEQAFREYEDRLAKGVSRELARTCLPVSAWTEWYWKIDLKNLLHFISLRSDPHAQKEIRDYSDVMKSVMQRFVPLTMQAFDDYVVNAITLSSEEQKTLRGEDSRMSGREKTELEEKVTW